jgi:hypothetical protein
MSITFFVDRFGVFDFGLDTCPSLQTQWVSRIQRIVIRKDICLIRRL